MIGHIQKNLGVPHQLFTWKLIDSWTWSDVRNGSCVDLTCCIGRSWIDYIHRAHYISVPKAVRYTRRESKRGGKCSFYYLYDIIEANSIFEGVGGETEQFFFLKLCSAWVCIYIYIGHIYNELLLNWCQWCRCPTRGKWMLGSSCLSFSTHFFFQLCPFVRPWFVSGPRIFLYFIFFVHSFFFLFLADRGRIYISMSPPATAPQTIFIVFIERRSFPSFRSQLTNCATIKSSLLPSYLLATQPSSLMV